MFAAMAKSEEIQSAINRGVREEKTRLKEKRGQEPKR